MGVQACIRGLAAMPPLGHMNKALAEVPRGKHQEVTKIGTSILLRSNIVEEQLIYTAAPKHWSGSCWTRCYGAVITSMEMWKLKN